jgi:hypothetical protein
LATTTASLAVDAERHSECRLPIRLLVGSRCHEEVRIRYQRRAIGLADSMRSATSGIHTQDHCSDVAVTRRAEEGDEAQVDKVENEFEQSRPPKLGDRLLVSPGTVLRTNLST